MIKFTMLLSVSRPVGRTKYSRIFIRWVSQKYLSPVNIYQHTLVHFCCMTMI